MDTLEPATLSRASTAEPADAATTAPLVSVIIPARNAAATLGETLDSLLAQVEPRWDAIIVNDGSTDETVDVAKAYMARDPRFQLIHAGGVGVSAARNLGLSKATGQWLLFLDSDDWIDRTYMSKLLAALAANPTKKAAFCAYYRVTAEGALEHQGWEERMVTEPFQLMARQCGTAIHTILIDRELVLELGGFDTSLKSAEDWDLWQRATRMGLEFAPVQEALAYYRMSPASLSRDMTALTKHGLAVLKRGFTEDPRVTRPHPEYARGASGSPDYKTCYSFMAIWCASAEIGEGRSGVKCLIRFGATPDVNDGVQWLADNIIEALAIGARLSQSELAEQWHRFEPAVMEMLEYCQAGTTRTGLTTRMRYHLARALLKHRTPASEAHHSSVLGLDVDLRRLKPVKAPAGVDLVALRFHCGRDRLNTIEVPYFGEISTAELAWLAARRIKTNLRGGWKGRVRRAASLLALGASAGPVIGGEVVSQVLKRGGFKPGVRTVLKEALEAKALESGNAEAVRRLAAAQTAPVVDPAEECRSAGEVYDAYAPEPDVDFDDRERYWDALFEREDPWNYGVAYEQVKYQRTLDLLRDEPIGSALELCCAEGWFTAKLAPRVERLIASDISPRAIQRAERRVGGAGNVEFRQIDVVADELPGGHDLVVCSEALYYFGLDGLRSIADKLAGALKPGGLLLHAHAFVAVDDPDRTAFDWPSELGVETIHAAFAETPGLRLERSIVTELYRIDLFRRTDEPAAAEPEIQYLDLGCTLEPDLAKWVKWGGAEGRRAQVLRSDHTNLVPVLMYHSVADEGPEGLRPYRQTRKQFAGHVQWLRQHGYWPVTSAEVIEYFEARKPFPGRPVMISFDDGMLDFYTNAWPILKEADFNAEMFIVTDMVGKTTAWDSDYGAPQPLMNWAEIRELSEQGVAFGSHMATHHAADALTSAELAAEAARSKLALETALGKPCRSIAAPFGIIDERFLYVAKVCGYEVGYSTDWGLAHRGSPRLRLPRIDVSGEWDLDTFAATMEYLNGIR